MSKASMTFYGCVQATLQAALSVGWLVGLSVCWSVAEDSDHATYGDRPFFQMALHWACRSLPNFVWVDASSLSRSGYIRTPFEYLLPLFRLNQGG